MWNMFRGLSFNALLTGQITVEVYYWRLYRLVAIVTVSIFMFSLVADVGEFNYINIVLIPIWVLTVAFFGFHPWLILSSAAFGMAGAAAQNQTIASGIRAGLETWKKFVVHTALFGSVFFLTRFMVPIKSNPFMGLLLLGAMIVIGLWAWAFGEKATWYKRYIKYLALVAIATALVGLMNGKSSSSGSPNGAPGHSAAPHRGVIKSAVNTINKEVANLFTDDWTRVVEVECAVSWENNEGWCNAGILEPGIYHVNVKYDIIKIRQQDGEVFGVPPDGISVLENYASNQDFINEFKKEAPLGGNLRFASLVFRVGGTYIDPLHKEKIEVLQTAPAAFGINFPPRKTYYLGVQNTPLRVELIKLVE